MLNYSKQLLEDITLGESANYIFISFLVVLMVFNKYLFDL